jgi:CubicO group peptidase (beta-lactamase class C family)
MKAVSLVLLCSLTSLAPSSFAASRSDPEAAGLDPARLSQIHARMKEFVDAGKTAGIVTLLARHGHVASLDAAGYQELESKTPMRIDSIFRIMSMTKPITCAGIMILVDEGRLSLLDPVEDFIPEFKNIKLNPCGTRVGNNCQLITPTRPIEILDLMTHMSGLGDGFQSRPRPGGERAAPPTTLREMVATANEAVLLFDPGTGWNYSNFGIAALGRVIEVVAKEPYERFMAERIFRPLGMKDTSFFLPPEKQSRLASLYTYEDGGLKPVARRPFRYPSPDSGLLSTAEDMARFNQMMLNKGVIDGQRILSAAAVEAMTRSWTGEIKAGYAPGVGQGFGFEVVQGVLGTYRYTSIGSFEKAGAFRTYNWVDPKKDLVGVILMQRTNGGSASDVADEINSFMAMAAAAIEP